LILMQHPYDKDAEPRKLHVHLEIKPHQT
jgi:hypothetical protein